MRLIAKVFHTNDKEISIYFYRFIGRSKFEKSEIYYIETDEVDLYINGKRYCIIPDDGFPNATIKDLEEDITGGIYHRENKYVVLF